MINIRREVNRLQRQWNRNYPTRPARISIQVEVGSGYKPDYSLRAWNTVKSRFEAFNWTARSLSSAKQQFWEQAEIEGRNQETESQDSN